MLVQAEWVPFEHLAQILTFFALNLSGLYSLGGLIRGAIVHQPVCHKFGEQRFATASDPGPTKV